MHFDARLFRQVHPYPKTFAAVLFTGFMAGLLGVGLAWSLSVIVDRVFLKNASLHELYPFLALLIALVLAKMAFQYVSDLWAKNLALSVLSGLRLALVRHLIRLGPSPSHFQNSGEWAHDLIKGIDDLEDWFALFLPQLALSVAIPLALLCFVFAHDFVSGLIMLLTAPLIPFFMMWIGHLAQAKSREQYRESTRLAAFFNDVLHGLTTLKLLGAASRQAQAIQQKAEAFSQKTLEVLKVAFLSALVLELLSTLSTAIIAVEVGIRLLYQNLEFQPAFFILLLAPEFYLPLRLLGSRFHLGMQGVEAAQKVFGVLEIQPRILGSVEPKIYSAPEILFDQVSYRYPNSERTQNVFENLTLRLKPNQITGIFGPSGTGKSTLAHLLLLFDRPSHGNIWVNGQDLSSFQRDVWLQHLAWASQNPFLPQSALQDFLDFPHQRLEAERIQEILKATELDDLIRSLPKGLQTSIGEDGQRLSGGERSRLALARALIKDAPLIILDEISAHWDPELERKVLSQIKPFLKGKTVLLISHRPSTLDFADVLYVFKEGKIQRAIDGLS